MIMRPSFKKVLLNIYNKLTFSYHITCMLKEKTFGGTYK